VTERSQYLKEITSYQESTIKERKKTMIYPQNPNNQNKANCPDCDFELNVPLDTEKGEIVSCPGCGLELEVKQVKCGCVDLQELTIEGEDWGE
jgi:lysine biosynthesis protein LysW